MIHRREFTTLLGSAATAWPFVAIAQQAERMRRIGVRIGVAETDPDHQDRMAAFRQELQKLGWTDGRNVRIDVRGASASDANRLRTEVAELLALAPDVILAAGGSVTVEALQRATSTIPIVFVGVIDPVGAGFVASLARPGGNTTGF